MFRKKATTQQENILILGLGGMGSYLAKRLQDEGYSPLYDPVAQIVYAAASRQVSHVWIDGVAQLKDFEFCQLDTNGIIAKAASWAQKIKS